MIGSLPNFRTLKEGDYVSAREWNAIVAFVKGMSSSSMTDGIMDSTGFHPRRRLVTPQMPIHLAYCKGNAGTGNKIECYLDADWNGSGAVPPTIEVNCFLFDATNLSDCNPRLTDGAAIPVWKLGETWYCDFWFSPLTRRAFCKTAAGSGSTIVCYLDTDTTGQEIIVYCNLHEEGENLSSCAPLLADGDMMLVFYDVDRWRSLTTFIPTSIC
jgi:hypothetical protein